MAWNDYFEGWKEPELLTDGEIELLLLDVSARIPFKLIAQFEVEVDDYAEEYTPVCRDFVVTAVDRREGNMFWAGGSQLQEGGFRNGTMDVAPRHECFKPYLRSMSNMTEEEKKEYDTFKFLANTGNEYLPYEMSRFVDWLNQHMFDYRGLIEKGLALEAPDDMYKFD